MLKYSNKEDLTYRALKERTKSILDGVNVDELYCDILLALIAQRGLLKDNRSRVNDLIEHLKKIFLLSDIKHAMLVANVESIKTVPLVLHVEVVAAEGLKRKNANGLSNPSCTVYNSPDRKESTSVKFETLNPSWQECFSLPVDNIEKDVLRVQLWNYPGKNAKRIKEVESNKGLKIFTKDISKPPNANGFLGRLQLPLLQIPSDGIDQWYSLQGKNENNRKNRGKIHLKLGLGIARERKITLKSYKSILHLVCAYEIACEQNIEPCQWDGVLSNELSKSILRTLEFQGGLTTRDTNMSLWIILTQVHGTQHSLNSNLFPVLLKVILENLNLPPLDENEISEFWQATQTLVEKFVAFFRNSYQYQNSPFQNVDYTRFHVQNMLKTLSMVNSYVITAASTDEKMKTNFPILNCIVDNMKSSVSTSACKFFEYIAPININFVESHVQTMINVLEVLIADLENNFKMYQNDFKEFLNVDYFGIQYLVYDRKACQKTKLGEIVALFLAQAFSNRKVSLKQDKDVSHFLQIRKNSETSLPGSHKIGLFTCMEYWKRSDVSIIRNYEDKQDENDSNATLLFKLYLMLKEFSSLSSKVANGVDKFCICGTFHNWFHDTIIVRWLEIARYKAMNCIKIAVLQDNLKPLDEFTRITSSAVDTAGILQRIEIWNQLSWPELEASALFSAKIIDDICGCAVYYSDLIWDQVQQKTNNSSCHYEISDELCFAINNIEKVAEETKLIVQTVINSWEAGKIETMNGSKVEETLKPSLVAVMENGNENIKNRINEILECVGLKMRPGIQILITEPEKSECEKYFTKELEKYVGEILHKLGTTLAHCTFNQVFTIIWENVLATMLSTIITNIEIKSHPHTFHRMQNIFANLINVFHDESSHDIRAVPNSGNVKEINTLLELHGATTPQLLLKYMQQRHSVQLHLQNTGISDSACLALRAYYCEDIQTLKIELLNARKLKPRAENGSRDSYVKILIMTEHALPLRVLKSKTIQKTLYPLFDDVFSVPLKLDAQKTSNQGVIMFTVKDRALLGSDIYIGDCFLTFESIPFRNSETDFKDLKQEIIPLTMVSKETLDSQVFKAVENRDWDKYALEFAQRERKKLP